MINSHPRNPEPNDAIMRKLLADRNEAEIKKKFQNYFALVKSVKLKTNLTPERLLALNYHPESGYMEYQFINPMYPRDVEAAVRNATGEKSYSNFYVEQALLKSNFATLKEAHKGGKVSGYFNEHLHMDEMLEVMPPMGGFNTTYHPSNTKTYMFWPAGSGISPVLSNLKEVLSGPNKQLFERYSDIDVPEATYFICGPADMIKGISDYLKKEKKVPAIQVLYEYFTAPDEENSEEMSEEFKAIANLESMVTVIIDDDEYFFPLNSEKRKISG
ncbi:hypothetical protein FQR65_LT18497 [Abscondita terminalis]|nr:hypothetical protein FQR65_LT18497 [Abscondita terminalis]